MKGFNIGFKCIVFSFFIFLHNNAFAYFDSGSDLFAGATEYVENKSSFKGAYYVGYVTATVDAIGESGANYLNIPSSVTVGQMCHIVKKYLDDHPEEWNRPATIIVYKSMVRAFPESVITKKTKK